MKAIGDVIAEGEGDFCNGHSGRGDDYHYHAAPSCIRAEFPAGMPFGYSHDGYPMYFTGGPDGDTTTADLDACGGATSASGEYFYMEQPSPPYLIGCFHGEVNKV